MFIILIKGPALEFGCKREVKIADWIHGLYYGAPMAHIKHIALYHCCKHSVLDNVYKTMPRSISSNVPVIKRLCCANPSGRELADSEGEIFVTAA